MKKERRRVLRKKNGKRLDLKNYRRLMKSIEGADPKIIEKTRPGHYKAKCLVCGKVFVTKQYNPKKVRRVCPECEEFHHYCICGKKVGFGNIYCSNKCEMNHDFNERIREGHKKQGRKIRGRKNPAKRQEVRKEIAKGVKESYKKDPSLRESRARSVKKLLKGKYSDGMGNLMKSKFELDVATLLQELNIKYEYENRIKVNGNYYFPDFSIKPNILIEVCGFILGDKSLKSYINKIKDYLKNTTFDIIVVTYNRFAAEFEDLKSIRHFDVVGVEQQKREQEIFINNITNVDYSHALPFIEGKCTRYHGHTSYKIDLRVRGFMKTEWLEDFSYFKDVVKQSVDCIDHRFVINSKYTKEKNNKYLLIEWDSNKGHHRLELPKEEVFLLENKEATLENISYHLANQILSKLDKRIFSVYLVMKEGVNNGVGTYVSREAYDPEDLESILEYHKLFSSRGEKYDQVEVKHDEDQ